MLVGDRPEWGSSLLGKRKRTAGWMKGSAFGKSFCCNRFDRHCHCTFRYYILHVSCPRRSSRKHRQSELVELGNFRGNHKPICIARHPVPKTIVILHFVLYDHWSAFSYKTMPQKLLIFFLFFSYSAVIGLSGKGSSVYIPIAEKPHKSQRHYRATSIPGPAIVTGIFLSARNICTARCNYYTPGGREDEELQDILKIWKSFHWNVSKFSSAFPATSRRDCQNHKDWRAM